MSHSTDDIQTDVSELSPIGNSPDSNSGKSHSRAGRASASELDFDDEYSDDESDDVEMDDADEEEVVAKPGFEQFNLSDAVHQSLKKIGYTVPTEVQLQCLPVLLEDKDSRGRDLVALARTGTGKTAAFGIPIIERIDTLIRKPQALVLCPTRELCQQVATSLGQIGMQKRVRVLSIYGGDSYRRQFEGLQQGPHIVVATPGRLIDLLDRKAVDFSSIRVLVLDEADEMISVGFREALDQILSSFSNREEGEPHCTWLFSATMSADVKRVQSRYISDSVFIDARGQEEKPLIRQQYMLTFEEDRLEALKRYLHVNENFYGLIFCQTKAEVAEVEQELKQEGFKVDSLHGDKVQRDREAVFAAWKKKTIKIVIATDVAARGLDVKGLTHVVNMSIPREDESYVHRIGRTGRAGLEGIALSFVWPKRIGILRQLERKLGVKMEHVQVPEPGDIARVVLGREIKALFAKPLEYVEGNPIHKTISELISESQSMDAEVLPWVSALAAKILESKNPGLLNRRTIKSLRADMAPSGGGSYGGSYGGRDGGRRPGGFGGRDGRRPGGFAGRDEGGRGGGMRGPRSGGGRFERPERRDRYAGEGRPEGRPEGRIEPRAAGHRADGPAPRIDRARPGKPQEVRATSRPSSDGPRLRDRRDDLGAGGGAPPKRRGTYERRERN